MKMVQWGNTSYMVDASTFCRREMAGRRMWYTRQAQRARKQARKRAAYYETLRRELSQYMHDVKYHA